VKTPIVLVPLVDTARQWIESRIGADAAENRRADARDPETRSFE